MKMEYELNEEKIIKDNQYSIDEIHNKLDNLMRNNHIIDKDPNGNYIGNDDNTYYLYFGKAFMELVDCEWFTNYASKCYWHVFGDVEDVLSAFHEYLGKKYA